MTTETTESTVEEQLAELEQTKPAIGQPGSFKALADWNRQRTEILAGFESEQEAESQRTKNLEYVAELEATGFPAGVVESVAKKLGVEEEAPPPDEEVDLATRDSELLDRLEAHGQVPRWISDGIGKADINSVKGLMEKPGFERVIETLREADPEFGAEIDQHIAALGAAAEKQVEEERARAEADAEAQRLAGLAEEERTAELDIAGRTKAIDTVLQEADTWNEEHGYYEGAPPSVEPFMRLDEEYTALGAEGRGYEREPWFDKRSPVEKDMLANMFGIREPVGLDEVPSLNPKEGEES